jgi:hypothetical protein
MKQLSFLFAIVFFASASMCTFAQSGDENLRVFLMDKKVLTKVKKSLQAGETNYSEPYKELTRRAKKLLSTKLHSITEKSQTPPSGDKRDYMSMAPYWWPDETKGEEAPYIRKDGVRNPQAKDIPDHKYLDEANQNIFTLSLAYYLSGDEVYAKKAVEFLHVWYLDDATRMNPNLNFAQFVKNANKGRGAGVLDGRSIIYCIEGLGLLDNSKNFTKEDKDKLRQWITEYRKWLLESKNGKQEGKAKNNHGSWYDNQVMAVSLYLGMDDFAKKYCDRLKELRIDYQFESDGKQPEELVRTKALGYSYFNLEAVSILTTYAWNLGIDYWNYTSPNGGSIKKGIDYLVPFTSGDKKWEYKQIAPLEPKSAVTVLIYAYKFYGDKSYLDLASKLDKNGLQKSFELLYLL